MRITFGIMDIILSAYYLDTSVAHRMSEIKVDGGGRRGGGRLSRVICHRKLSTDFASGEIESTLTQRKQQEYPLIDGNTTVVGITAKMGFVDS